MNSISQLQAYCRQKANDNPSLYEQIMDLYQLACDEIDDGNSIASEAHKCMEDIEQLIQENQNS